MRDSGPEACGRLEEEVCSAVREYHALYASVDALRIKRDLLVADLNRIQDRIEKLRLKVSWCSGGRCWVVSDSVREERAWYHASLPLQTNCAYNGYKKETHHLLQCLFQLGQ